MIIIYFFIIYISIVFIVSRFVIPHLGLSETALPDKIPAEMKKKIMELKSKTGSPREFLESAYDFLGSKRRSERLNTFLKFHYLFKNLEFIWEREGYIPCTQNNLLMRIFLVRSGFFRDKDIKTKHVFANFVIHQYLQVKLDGKWIDVDVGEKQRGLPIGKHLGFFG